MKLSFDQIKSIVTGAVRVYEDGGAVCFDRFTPYQREVFTEYSEQFYGKTFSCAGMRLRFRTNSTTLYLRSNMEHARARTCFCLEVAVNGQIIDAWDNFSHLPDDENFLERAYPMGPMEKHVDLGEGEKDVCVYLPWNAKVLLQELSVDDGAFIEPSKPAKKLLVFGDSITAGFDARRPSNRYIGRVADALGAEEFNKAIGGSVFVGKLTAEKEDIEPDYIIVAYGSNDWSVREKEVFEQNCKEFLTNLRHNYPNVPIFAITPIWRKKHSAILKLGPFSYVDAYIRQVADQLENVQVIGGFDLVPHDSAYFADLILHPNDAGFDHYFTNLWEHLKKLV